MTKPIVRIHNTETNEIIDREMTNAEFSQYEKQQAESLARKAQDEVNANAKTELLNRLGITVQEAQLLLS
jgi:hypothetical protein